jgi:hypothetical protein
MFKGTCVRLRPPILARYRGPAGGLDRLFPLLHPHNIWSQNAIRFQANPKGGQANCQPDTIFQSRGTEMKRLGQTGLLGLVVAVGALSASSTAVAQPRLARSPFVRPSQQAPTKGLKCTGTPEAPGVLAGEYTGRVAVEGVCVVNAGVAVIHGSLTITPGSTLLAAFALNDVAGSGKSRLDVHGNVWVREGATMLLGCQFEHFPCLDDPEPENPTLSAKERIFGDLSEREPLGVVAHNDIVFGNIRQRGGGGGVNCEPSGVFTVFESPVFSAYELMTVSGTVQITDVKSCWMGLVEDKVSGTMRLLRNQLADPDAIEILSNKIHGNLNCQNNSMTWDSEDATEEGLFPRNPAPNSVAGERRGQCKLASPETEGGPPGPGPF